MAEPTQQTLLTPEIPEDALSDDIAALGGHWKVAKRLRPELDQKAARDWLLNCLNPNHKQNLTLGQIRLIVGWARAEGHTSFCEFWPTDNNMSRPVKIEPEDEKAKLQRQFVGAVGELSGMLARIEKLNGECR